MSDAPALNRDPLQRAVGVLWPGLPMLLCGAVLTAVPWTLIRMFVPDGGPFAVLAVGLLVVPPFATLLHGCGVLLTGDHFGGTQLLRAMPRTAITALKVTALPTGGAVLTSVSLEVWRHGGPGWVVASVGVGGAVTLLSGLVTLVALPYVMRTGVNLTEGWLVAGYVTSRSPVPVLAAASAVMLTLWISTHLSFALIILLPGPLALVWAAAIKEATGRCTERLVHRADTRL